MILDRLTIIQEYGKTNPYLSETTHQNEEDDSKKLKKKKKRQKITKLEDGTDYDMVNTQQKETSLHDFYQLILPIKDKLVIIRSKLDSYKIKGKSQLEAINEEQKKQARDKLSKLSNKITTLFRETRDLLDECAKVQMEYLDNNDQNLSMQVDVRIKTNIYTTISQQYFDLFQEFYNIQEDTLDQSKKMMIHQYEVVNNKTPTSEEVEQFIENDDTSFFIKDLSYEKRIAAQNALNYVKDRHTQLLRLRSQLNEIMELMQDMQAMVYDQGLKIDSILQHSENINNNIQEAVSNLRDAYKTQKKGCIVM